MLMETCTAKAFIQKLQLLRSKAALENNQRFFRHEEATSKFIGVRMASLFAVAKSFIRMPLKELEQLLNSDFYEARMGAVCIMDFQARDSKVPADHQKALFDLYVKKHDRINNWDMVDRGAPHVIGRYLIDKPRKILYKLAKSKNPLERRTAIVATWFFIRQNDVQDCFDLARILVKDKHDLVQKAVGSWIREAGKRDLPQLLAFLDQYAAIMPREMIRYAVEKLDIARKDHYLSINKLNNKK